MDRSKFFKKSLTNKNKLSYVLNLFKKLKTYSQIERRKFFSSISKHDILIISEVVLNFLKNNIPLEFKAFALLKKI